MEGCVPLDDLLSGEPTASQNDKLTNQEEEPLAPEQHNRRPTLHPYNESGPIESQYPPDPPPTPDIFPSDPSTPHIFPSEPPNTTVTLPDGAKLQPMNNSGSPVNSYGLSTHGEQAGNGEVGSDDDDALSVSDSSSMCSDSSLDDLADYLNTSQGKNSSSAPPLPPNAPTTPMPTAESSSVLPLPPNAPTTQTPTAESSSALPLPPSSPTTPVPTAESSSALPLPPNAPTTPMPTAESSSALPLPPNAPATQTPTTINPSCSSPLVLAHGNNQQDGTLFESSCEDWEASALEEELCAAPTVTAPALPAPVAPDSALLAPIAPTVTAPVLPAPVAADPALHTTSHDSGDSEDSSAEETEFTSFLSPLPCQSLQLLSPLPPTPRDSHQILSPPLTLREPVVSPLPQTPDGHQDSTQLMSTPLPQFADSAPVGLLIPTPCLVHSATNINPNTPRLVQKQLKLSESSPFSPPFDSSLTLEACLSVSSSGTAFEATSLELCCETRKMKPDEILARSTREQSRVEGDGGERRERSPVEGDGGERRGRSPVEGDISPAQSQKVFA